MGRTLAFRVSRILYARGSSHENERGPVVRVRVSLLYLDQRFPQGLSAVRAVEEACIERLHEVCCAAVVHIPQCEKDALRPGGKQAPDKPHKFIPSGNYI